MGIQSGEDVIFGMASDFGLTKSMGFQFSSAIAKDTLDVNIRASVVDLRC